MKDKPFLFVRIKYCLLQVTDPEKEHLTVRKDAILT